LKTRRDHLLFHCSSQLEQQQHTSLKYL